MNRSFLLSLLFWLIQQEVVVVVVLVVVDVGAVLAEILLVVLWRCLSASNTLTFSSGLAAKPHESRRRGLVVRGGGL